MEQQQRRTPTSPVNIQYPIAPKQPDDNWTHILQIVNSNTPLRILRILNI